MPILKEATGEVNTCKCCVLKDSEASADCFASNEEALNETGSSDPEVEQIVQLPGTVTKLTSKEGVKVYIVGAEHFSVKSQEDVAKTIIMTRPRVVMVELHASCLVVLKIDEDKFLEEVNNIDSEKIWDMVKQKGVDEGLGYSIILLTFAYITRQCGMTPGGQYRRAWKEASGIPGCRFHLGDRPVHVILQRALAALSFWQKTKIIWRLIRRQSPFSSSDVEFDLLERVFIEERELYLAHSLQLAAADAAKDAGKLNGEAPAVVGVVGIGHIPGIVRHFGQVTESDVKKVMEIPPPSLFSRVMTVSFKLSIAGLLFYGCYKITPKLGFNLSSIRQGI